MYSFIDSTVAEIWLPREACDRFQKAFGLLYDETTQLYFVHPAQHKLLEAANPNITFSLSPAPSSEKVVTITLPYAAFDMIAKPPYRGLTTEQRYFPLRRAANATQYTLGRTFLQEAYLTVDWERQNFSVSQNSWVANAPKQIMPIMSVNSSLLSTSKPSRGASVSTGAMVGIALGIILLICVVGVLSFLLWRSNRRRKLLAKKEDSEGDADSIFKKKMDESPDPNKDEFEAGTNVIPKVELDAGEESTIMMLEKDSSCFIEKGKKTTPASHGRKLINTAPFVEAPDNVIFELPGDLPRSPEADSRELTEKEAMRVREDRYNGVDENPSPIAPPSYSPISPLSPSEGNGTQGSVTSNPRSNVSPVSPSESSTLGTRKERRKKIDPSNIRAVAAHNSASRGTPGERLEAGDGWSLRGEPSSEEGSAGRKRFSFET